MTGGGVVASSSETCCVCVCVCMCAMSAIYSLQKTDNLIRKVQGSVYRTRVDLTEHNLNSAYCTSQIRQSEGDPFQALQIMMKLGSRLKSRS